MSSPNRKIQPLSRLKRIIVKHRKAGEKVVFTNGCFDILHAGHVTYLEQAKGMGDVLVVGLNSDQSVRSIKGPGRPVNPEKDRLKVLSSLTFVDYVALFSEDTPLRLICALRPDVLVKGADWRENQIAGAREIKSWGGVVKRVRLVPGRSTTTLIKKMKSQ